MADNTTLNVGAGGDVIASDDIAGVKYQRVKIAVGADGAAADAALTAPLPVRLSDGSAAITTLPVSLASVPSHAVTNEGTFATQVDGAALTALQLIDNLVLAEDAAHQSSDPGVQMLTVRRDTAAATSGTDGDYQPMTTDANGRAHVIDKNSDLALTALQLIDDTVNTDDAAFTVATGKGIAIMGVASSDTVDSGDVGVIAMTTGRCVKTVVTNSSGSVIDPQVDDAAFTPATSLLSVVGGVATTDAVDSGDAGAFAMTLTRAQHVTLKTDTVGGTSVYKSLDLDESEEEVKASAGTLYWVHAVNLTDAPIYLKFYNATAANVTVGTTTPVLTFPVVSQGTVDGAGFVFSIPHGIAFGTAITMAATTGVADNDTGAPGANALVVNVGYA